MTKKKTKKKRMFIGMSIKYKIRSNQSLSKWWLSIIYTHRWSLIFMWLWVVYFSSFLIFTVYIHRHCVSTKSAIFFHILTSTASSTSRSIHVTPTIIHPKNNHFLFFCDISLVKILLEYTHSKMILLYYYKNKVLLFSKSFWKIVISNIT